MNAPGSALLAAATALAAAMLLAWNERPVRWPWLALWPAPVLAVLAAGAVPGLPGGALWTVMLAGLAVALMSRARDDPYQSEAALKLLWVVAAAAALSVAAERLLALATGTAVVREQWAVLAMGLEAEVLWSLALPLTLLAGFVLLGGAPFHFWLADVLQGARPAYGPLVVVALQVQGAAWVLRRIEGVEAFPAAARLLAEVLALAAGTALAAGALTLFWQRRPERRVGTLASLQGGLALAVLAGGAGSRGADPAWFAAWAAHALVALTGAATLARLLPVEAGPTAPPAVIVRRHPGAAVAGLLSLASLAGVPGTPGSLLWFGAAQRLAAGGATELLIALALAWGAAFTFAVEQLRAAFGAPTSAPPMLGKVPRALRGALWLPAAALVAQAIAAAAGRGLAP